MCPQKNFLANLKFLGLSEDKGMCYNSTPFLKNQEYEIPLGAV